NTSCDCLSELCLPPKTGGGASHFAFPEIFLEVLLLLRPQRKDLSECAFVSCLRRVQAGATVIMVREKSMRLIIAICAAFVLGSPAASAQDVAAFYRGKQLRFVVGSSVGGAYDLYARALARQIVHYIPGNPTIIVQNQPAAGGMVMTNQIYNQGPKDG